MSIAVIIQFAALAVIVAIGVCIVYVIFEMREVYAEQRSKFIRAISAVEEFQKLQPEFVAVLQKVESDGHALQKIAVQIEVSVAALKNSIGSSVSGAAERQTAASEGLRDHLDAQEERLAKVVESISETLRAMPAPQPLPPPPPPPMPVFQPERKPENGDYVRLRKEVVSQDPQLRFSVLRDWISTNALAILHRAGRGYTNANDLIAGIPAYLEAEAEILGGRVLLIGTRGHSEKLAIPIGDLDPSSDLTEWFDAGSNGHGAPSVPAVLMRSNGHFELISKGTSSETGH